MNSLSEILASQKVRVFDVYALGPFMVWYAMKSREMGPWSRRILFTAGVYTVIYNWQNYVQAEKFLAEKAKEIL